MNTEPQTLEVEVVTPDPALVKFASKTGLEKQSTETLVEAFRPIFVKAREAIAQAAGVAIDSAELAMQAMNTVEVDAAHARSNLRLIEHLEDHDDVQRVTANFEIPDEVFAEAASA